MWHEARKQERLIRGMIVDYRRRAERRRDFYEKIKADPTQFLQIHGRPCKIHLDPAVAAVGDSLSVMMPWQGEQTIMIDRFDVRAHLDFIPEIKVPEVPIEEQSHEERHCNYERYRILAQNSFLGISEDKFLRQLEIEEQFGVTLEEKEQQKEKLNEKKGIGAAIAYNYDDSTPQPSATIGPQLEPKFNSQGALKTTTDKDKDKDDSEEDSDLEIIDVDLSIDVNKVEPAQAHELNCHGPRYGMAGSDLFSFLTGDADDAEQQKQLMREEKEKAMFSGRKSRRERRAQRDKKLAHRVVTTPSYALGPVPDPLRKDSRSQSRSRSPSRTPSPSLGGRIQFITSFGGDDEPEENIAATTKMTYADKVKLVSAEKKTYASAVRDAKATKNQSSSPSPRKATATAANVFKTSRFDRSRSRSRSRSRRSPSRRSRSRNSSKSPYRQTLSRYKRSRSRSRRSNGRSHSRSKSRDLRSRSKSRYRSKSSDSSSTSSSSSSDSYRRRRSRSRSRGKSHPRGGAATPAVPRYYGRRAASKSSSELSLDSHSSDDQSKHKDKSTNNSSGAKASSYSNVNRFSGASNKSYRRGARERDRDSLSIKDKLRRKMQAQLSRQLRADKKAEAERMEREQQQQQERDDEMREMAIKIRRMQREKRHMRSRYSYSPGSGSGHSHHSRSPSPQRRRRSSEREHDRDYERRHDDRDRYDRTTERRRIPVWQHEDTERSRPVRNSGSWRRSDDSDDRNSPVKRLVDY